MMDKTIGIVTTGKIIKIDGAYYREFTYRKKQERYNGTCADRKLVFRICWGRSENQDRC